MSYLQNGWLNYVCKLVSNVVGPKLTSSLEEILLGGVTDEGGDGGDDSDDDVDEDELIAVLLMISS